ncbi:MAG: methylmalonate-semialdehyde dehydrogenase (acylating) [Bacteroidetes bacterium GWF2_42_66]|nr:MAG: methylmalonate-semialdehyde dehydrogenase (acylating) [Bacteroidetes bacterium GWA2_42_15]OFY01317.1 MAG: methylmalonate-semialdehyde dehydrogenase (acylating) [Bacteroidetes bacterium GWE2_42_39]OFY42161.1 MAG: methylmalonate-semialdehyde dehydrogenase (acylating) [Bacteroidetes bacterium GWF2_42_66]HBL77630.1 methylmalonate-semialdehyde dehydrogenase (CoA acylating) [Prolixibacteraceae bacterium]HCB62759.1 methylmalonate-semialdehyde dehydrogenase (CoA acylating) [Bacteroidales bacter
MEILKNYINGSWTESREQQTANVVNPANQEVLAKVPYGEKTVFDVASAVSFAVEALKEWRDTPVMKRVQPLYKLKQLLEENIDEIARLITLECGKSFAESKAEMQRAIENVETACGTPMLIQSEFSENVATGIDEFMIRQPVGVCVCISPFNFPGMIPFWFLPYAIACGNSFIVKPSEKVPLTMMKVFELIDQLDLPKGLINLVHGGKASVDALLDHPDVKAISFVGSTNVARYIYQRGAANGKRVQAQGGAKNPVIVMPDADIDMTARIIADSVYGCAGQRCLAASNIITVGDHDGFIKEALAEAAKSKTTGFGLDAGIEMGPVISPESKIRIENLIAQGVSEGANLLLDGRNAKISGYEAGNFIKPTILENVALDGEVVKTEIFGPVMSLLPMDSIDQAIDFVNNNAYGNMACLFTSSGLNARTFRNRANAGNIGINIGVAAPMAQFPFSGWNNSFFGDLHGQGRHGIEFFTQTKVVIERWPKEWLRKF